MKYKIKQIRDIKNCDYAFKHYDWCKDQINLNDYEVVYEGELDYEAYAASVSRPDVLDHLFYIFNMERPEDFKGHSLSVSDIVEIDGVNYYCDAMGWVKLEDK